MLMKNYILYDNYDKEIYKFRHILEETTKHEWDIWACKSDINQNKKILVFYRYLLLFIFPFMVFMRRRKLRESCIVSWQQFYGLVFAFYCRIFHVEKSFRLVVMTFIFKEKQGIIGEIYHHFMNYILDSKYIDIIICTSKAEIQLYSKIFPDSAQKFYYIPWGEDNCMELLENNRSSNTCNYIFSTGRSNRDYKFLIDSLKGSKYKLKIACDTLKGSISENIDIYDNMYGISMISCMRNCYCVVIALQNSQIAAGQRVFLQAMSLGKPVILTASKGITDDYVIDGYNGIVIDKNKEDLINALDNLFEDRKLYDRLSNNGISEFRNKYSKDLLGKNIGELLVRENMFASY